jgi:hypothetical protein
MLYAFLSAIFVGYVSAQCSWTDTSSGNTLNLAKLKGSTIDCIGTDNTNYKYTYTPCENGLTCDSQSVMGIQTYIGGTNEICYYIAQWDGGVIQPVYSQDQDGVETWSFYYPNGEATGGCSASGRSMIINWTCDSSQKSPNPSAHEASTCQYEMDIIWSCKGGGGGGSSSSNDLSGGWIFIIILICVFAVYCIFGYVWNKTRNEANGWGDVSKNTPHHDFWCHLHQYVIAGCVVTKEKITGGGSGSTHQEIPDEA